MAKRRFLLTAVFSLIPMLSGCGLLASNPVTAPPPPPQAIEPHAVQTSTPTPIPAGTARPGDIVFIAEGRVFAIRPDGSNKHVVYAPHQGAVVRDLAVSPDGHYLAFTLDGNQAMLLDLTLGQVVKIEDSPSDRFGSFAWSPASDAVYYYRIVIGASGKPSRCLVMRAPMPPGSPAEKALDFDLASNLPIVPVAIWRGGLVILHQVDPGGGSLGQWLVFDPVAQSVAPLLKDHGLWDVSPERTQMLLFSTADLAAGPQGASVPIYSAGLDLARGAVSVSQITPKDQQIHLESARFAPDGQKIAALQFVQSGNGVRQQTVLLTPVVGGAYQISRLAPDDAADDLALAWSSAGLVVQRLRGGQSELWLVPLDGSGGLLLTTGEQPVVVSGG